MTQSVAYIDANYAKLAPSNMRRLVEEWLAGESTIQAFESSVLDLMMTDAWNYPKYLRECLSVLEEMVPLVLALWRIPRRIPHRLGDWIDWEIVYRQANN